MTTPAERLAQLAGSLNASGVVPFAQVTTHTHVVGDVTGLAPHSHVHGEQFTGNGVLTQFTLAHAPLYGVTVYVAAILASLAGTWLYGALRSHLPHY